MFSLRVALQVLSISAVIKTADARVFESLHEVPRGWKLSRAAAGDESIKLRLSLKQQNENLIIDKLMEVSTPDHSQYGMHYEGHELRSLLKPTDETTSKAFGWLQDYNITSIGDDSDYLLIRTDVKTANKLLDTSFAWYQSIESKEEVLRTLRYSVPEEVSRHINFIQPTTRFVSLKGFSSGAHLVSTGIKSVGISKWQTNGASQSNCNNAITPQCLFDLYNIHYKGDLTNGNTVGYASFLNQYARYTDLARFEEVYAPYATGQNFSVVEYSGGLNDQDSKEDSGEANLDNQYILALGYPTPVTEFSVGGRGLLVPDGSSPTQDNNTNEPYLDFLLALRKLPNEDIPNSISISYGENEQEIPVEYAKSVCRLFAELGARGKSIIFASGDSGTGDYCLSNDGKETLKFQPQFPATCPYVTSVGGTHLMKPETAVFFSSGGFSNIWERPFYQDAAVNGYLEQIGDQNAGLYNKSGRGFPDVAAQSMLFRVINQGDDDAYDGTSCAAPVFNGIIALLNSARLSSGLPTLGFLNPWIYSKANFTFTDIITGAATGCTGQARFGGSPNGGPMIPGAAWNATKGWDPVTGLGTPDFGKLLELSTPGVANTGGVA